MKCSAWLLKDPTGSLDSLEEGSALLLPLGDNTGVEYALTDNTVSSLLACFLL
jgi:hypothetical protein